jgi:hypothetical protein
MRTACRLEREVRCSTSFKSAPTRNVSAVIMAFRMALPSPENLKNYLSVAYFRECEATPRMRTSYYSGFQVREYWTGKLVGPAKKSGDSTLGSILILKIKAGLRGHSNPSCCYSRQHSLDYTTMDG